ncbi:MAG: MATE family efflux transporter [Lachnospiraceae bacterium]|nr:MATE family efflux transporter [Lachnospiraceae bacterium]
MSKTKEIENNLYEGSVLKKLILFAIPFLLSNIVQSFYNVADMLIVGNFSGAASMSGVNLGGQITFILTNMVIGLSVGATVLIGQYVGMKNEEGLKRVTATIITLLIILGIGLTIITFPFRDAVVTWMQTPKASIPECRSYLGVTLTGLIFIFGYNALSAILRGMGDSKHPLYFVTIACATNVVLDLVFVGGFHMRAFGAALATVISQAVSMFLCIIYLATHDFHFDFKLRSFRIYKRELLMIIKIGLPTSIQNTITSLSFACINAIANMVGGVYGSAAVGAVGKFNSFAFMPAVAMSSSISTMTAQNLGAGKPERAVKACKIGTIFAVLITFTFFLIMHLIPAQILALFGHNPKVIKYGLKYITTWSFDLLLVPFTFCINGMFIGFGHTMFTMFTNMASAILFRVPVCYIFAVVMHMGIQGVGLGAPTATAATLIIVVGYLLSGKWKTNAVKTYDK